jgi:hypothetical protein
MQFESATNARQSAAIRLMERVDRLMKADRVFEVIPVAGDPPPGRSVLAERQLFEELEVMRIAERGPLRATGAEQANAFRLARDPNTHQGATVPRATIMRLVDKGLMRWINSSRTAVELVGEVPEPPRLRNELPNTRRTPE